MRAKILHDVAGLSTGTELEVVDSYCGTDGFYYTCELPKGNQITINSNLVKITDTTPYINWEQRRYEIAKAAIQGMWANTDRRFILSSCKQFAEMACSTADALIEELKKK